MFPRVLVSVFMLGFAIYFLRVPVSIVLDVVNVQRLAFDPKEILGFGLFYVFLLFLWSSIIWPQCEKKEKDSKGK